MSYCSNCGNPLDENVKFCANCGTPVAAPEATVAPVVPAVPTYVEPAAPVVPVKAKVLGFVGMGLAIGGLIFAIIGLLYTFVFMSVEAEMGFIFAFVWSIFSLPLSIIGGVLCSRGAEMGNHSAPCSVGSKLRIAGIIVSAVMLFFGFISLVM